MSDKKKMQLGMNHSTARARLVKDLLWNFIVKTDNDTCCKCGEKMEKDNFSIEHVKPWLDSEDPVGLFFDIENISYSHLQCNVVDRRNLNPANCGTVAKYTAGCKCDGCRGAWNQYKRNTYNKEERAARYRRTGN